MKPHQFSALLASTASGFFFVRPVLEDYADKEGSAAIYKRAMAVHDADCKKLGMNYTPQFSFVSIDDGLIRLLIGRKTGDKVIPQCYVDLKVVIRKCEATLDLCEESQVPSSIGA